MRRRIDRQTRRPHGRPHDHHDRTPSEESESTDRPLASHDLRHEMDEILDEIDEVLEANAAEFVAAYVQKGGE